LTKKRSMMLVLIVLIIGGVGYGYYYTKSSMVLMGDYISITYSEAVENSDDINTQIWSYDCITNESKKVFEFEYTSQYPLGYYDRENELVYYTKRKTNNDEEYGDQIFVTDLSNNKEQQLTEDLFAVNYIIPAQDQLFFAGRPKGGNALRLGAIDKKTNEISYWGDEDTNIEAMTVDTKNKKIYASTYSEKERQYNAIHQEGPVGQDNFKMPKFTVYEIGFDFNYTQMLFSENMWIRTVMFNGESVVALCDKRYNDDAATILYSYNLKTKKMIETIWDTKRLQNGDANYSSDGKNIYGISDIGGTRGVFEIHLDTQSYKPLFIQENGFINNVKVVKGTIE